METIWKFPFEIGDQIEIEMPSLSEILTVQMQGKRPCLWARVYDDAPMVKRKFELFGTGHKMPRIDQRRDYVGTFQVLGGQLIFHLFELK